MTMNRWSLAMVVAALAPLAGCASAQAKAPADRPTLNVPEPPPRVIEAPPRPESAGPEPVAELPPPPASTAARPRPAATRETPRPDPKPAEPPPSEAVPSAAAPPVAPAPQLRTAGSADGAEAARQVREIVERVNKALSSIDYRRQNTARREQYDTAKRLVTQAEEAMKGSNFDIARNLADKADRIARELQVRR